MTMSPSASSSSSSSDRYRLPREARLLVVNPLRTLRGRDRGRDPDRDRDRVRGRLQAPALTLFAAASATGSRQRVLPGKSVGALQGRGRVLVTHSVPEKALDRWAQLHMRPRRTRVRSGCPAWWDTQAIGTGVDAQLRVRRHLLRRWAQTQSAEKQDQRIRRVMTPIFGQVLFRKAAPALRRTHGLCLHLRGRHERGSFEEFISTRRRENTSAEFFETKIDHAHKKTGFSIMHGRDTQLEVPCE